MMAAERLALFRTMMWRLPRRQEPLACEVRRAEPVVEPTDADVAPSARGRHVTRLSVQEKDTALFALAASAPEAFDDAMRLVMDLRVQVAAEQSLEAVSS